MKPINELRHTLCASAHFISAQAHLTGGNLQITRINIKTGINHLKQVIYFTVINDLDLVQIKVKQIKEQAESIYTNTAGRDAYKRLDALVRDILSVKKILEE